jgi:pimeloyl-ACP methyl ester carboxylesterase
MPATTRTITLGVEKAALQLSEYGDGRHLVLLLHGGAGPTSVDAFAQTLATERDVRVVAPTHPGFSGTERQPGIDTIADIAALYDALLNQLGATDATVIGNSIGGWIASELALRGNDRLGRLVLVDAVGLPVDGHPVADFFALDLDQLAELSYADPDRYRIDPSALPPAAQQAMAASRQALRDYAGTSMVDETLAQRLPGIRVPTLVVWGDHDRIVDEQVGRAYASAIPAARFVLLERTGHLPQLESPDRLLEVLDGFAF